MHQGQKELTRLVQTSTAIEQVLEKVATTELPAWTERPHN